MSDFEELLYKVLLGISQKPTPILADDYLAAQASYAALLIIGPASHASVTALDIYDQAWARVFDRWLTGT